MHARLAAAAATTGGQSSGSLPAHHRAGARCRSPAVSLGTHADHTDRMCSEPVNSKRFAAQSHFSTACSLPVSAMQRIIHLKKKHPWHTSGRSCPPTPVRVMRRGAEEDLFGDLRAHLLSAVTWFRAAFSCFPFCLRLGTRKKH